MGLYLYDVVAIALSIVGFLLSLQGLWLVCRALWPRRVAITTLRCQRNGVASFVVGVPVTALSLAVAAALGKHGAPGQLSGFALLFAFLLFAGVGMSGLVTYIGQRLASPVDGARPWRATVRGGIVLELAYLIPFLGWFGLLPASIIIGAGAATLSLLGSGHAPTNPIVENTLTDSGARQIDAAYRDPAYQQATYQEAAR